MRTFHPDGTVTYHCRSCKGVAHPASGQVVGNGLLCSRCWRELLKFWGGRLKVRSKPGRPSFYDHIE